MRNIDWVNLTDAQRGQLISIWLLAADNDGQIPDDPEIIKKLCYMQSKPDINLFISLGFIDGCQHDANMTSTRRQSDALDKTRLDKTRLEETKRRDVKTSLPDNFSISDNVKKWAEGKRVNNLDQHLEAFKMKCRAKGYKYINWDSAFMEAIRANWANLEETETSKNKPLSWEEEQAARRKLMEDLAR